MRISRVIEYRLAGYVGSVQNRDNSQMSPDLYVRNTRIFTGCTRRTDSVRRTRTQKERVMVN